MKIVFTVCSNNYLGQAKALGDSVLRHAPDYKFFICLADKADPGIAYKSEIGHEIILAEELGIDDFDLLWKRYDIIEFNTCIKPFCFEYLVKKFEPVEYIHYLDPDTMLLEGLTQVEDEFENNNVLLTPHIISPIEDDGKRPVERQFLNFGIYNLGFLGLKDPVKCMELLVWWKSRTRKHCYNKPELGLFVDQIWFNLVPIFFDRVKVSMHPGLNMAPWNLHERKISSSNSDSFEVNGSHRLVFFHFSTYQVTNENQMTKYFNRFDFSNREDLVPLYSTYKNNLDIEGIRKFSNIPCSYMDLRNEFLKNQESKLKRVLRKIIPEKLIRIWHVIRA